MTSSVKHSDTVNSLQVKIYLLGRFEIRFGERILSGDAWPRKKAASLMKRLAFEHRLLKDQAMEFLWPEADLSAAANNLYKTLHVIRRTLESNLGSGVGDAVFRFEGGILTLQPDVWVDTVAFEQLTRSGSGIDQKTNLEMALEIYKNDLLPDDLYEEWTLLPRDELFRLQRSARLALASIHRLDQNYEKAINLLRPLLAREPADEPVHRDLMRLYAFSGQHHEALRQYETCVDVMKRELDTVPEEETTALHKQILNGELAPTITQDQPDTAGLVKINLSALPTEEGPRPLFVARERELKFLQGHMKATFNGAGQVVFISGEAGQGKTSLMAEFAYQAQVQNPDLVVSTGACQNLSGIADPYLPFRDLVAMLSGDWQRPWVGGDITLSAAQRLQDIALLTTQTISKHAPDLIDIIAPPNVSTQRNTPNRKALNQHQVFEQIGNLFSILSVQKPLLLLLDDLQWIDTASANLLFYLVRRLKISHVMIIGAFRPSEVMRLDSIHTLAPIVQELSRDRGDIRIDLDANQPEEERRFVDVLLNSEPNRLDSSFREALFRLTRGNPLFSVELIKTLKDQGDLVIDNSGMWTAKSPVKWDILPARVEAVVARRIERLPLDLRQLLETASIEGEYFTVEVLAQLHEISILPLLQKLSQELDYRYRLVYEQGDLQIGNQTITRYHFRHNLFQQYLYQQLSHAQRRYLHARVAVVLEQIGVSDLSSLVIPIAYHFLAAGDTTSAVPYLIQAGDDARRRVALDDAVHFYESALDYWQEYDPDSKAQVLQKVGEMFLALGNSSKAIERFSEADQLFAQAGNRTGMGAIQRLIGRSYFEQGDRVKALNHYHRVLSLLEHDSENAELARATSAIAQMHMTANQYDEAIDWGERALSLGRETDLEDVILHALVSLGTSLANKGEAERGLAMLAESQERAVALGLPHDAGRAYAGWGDALVTLERYEEAREIYNRMLAYAQNVHTGMFEGVALVQLGYLDWWAGRWRQAWTRRQEIIDWMAAVPGASFVKVWASNLLGLIYNDLGMPEKAGAILAEYAVVARSAQEPQTTVPHLGQLARCVQPQVQKVGLMQEIFTLTDTATYPAYEIMPSLRLACGWFAQTSRGDLTTLDRLEKVHFRLQNHQSAASLYEVRAIAAGIRGDWGQAVSHYKVSAENWEALKRSYDLLRTLAGMLKALSFIHLTSTKTEDRSVLQDIRMKTGFIIKQLADELDEPEVKQAFLASPLVMELQSN